MEYDFVKRKADYLNDYMRNVLCEIRKTMRVEFLTDTLY